MMMWMILHFSINDKWNYWGRTCSTTQLSKKKLCLWILKDIIDNKPDKEEEKTIKEYEYLLNEKQSTLDNYIKYFDTACELAKIDKLKIIEIVQKNKKNMINTLLI